MYLFSKNNNQIEIFKLEEVEDKIFEYRKKEMKKIAGREQVLRAVATVGNQPLIECGNNVNWANINYQRQDTYHRIELYPLNSVYYTNTLEDYYYKGAANARLISVNDQSRNHELELLLTNPRYKTMESNEIVMEGIINIPETLKYLYFFENGQFDNVPLSFLYEINGLYAMNKRPLLSINVDKLEQLKETGLVLKTVSNREIENDTKKVKLLQKIFR